MLVCAAALKLPNPTTKVLIGATARLAAVDSAATVPGTLSLLSEQKGAPSVTSMMNWVREVSLSSGLAARLLIAADVGVCVSGPFMLRMLMIASLVKIVGAMSSSAGAQVPPGPANSDRPIGKRPS